jgi:diketogulonate reductase-like aldo/keto reductase
MHFDLMYGTAWKEELTESCVLSAIQSGFRAIDTANQRKHYNEQGVGEGLKKIFAQGEIKREHIFLQTKFTYARGQDHRKPYDENALPSIQVEQSIQSSLSHLGTTYLDSYLLHGPFSSEELHDTDLEVWQSMEALYDSGVVRALGIANFNGVQLQQLYSAAKVKPSYLQNRCLAQNHWDEEVRELCGKLRIRYQGFSLLTNNSKYLGGTILRPKDRTVPQLVFENDFDKSLHPEIQKIVQDTNESIQRIILRFAQQIDILPLVGTRSQENMRMNQNLKSFSLTKDQIDTIKNVAFLE